MNLTKMVIALTALCLFCSCTKPATPELDEYESNDDIYESSSGGIDMPIENKIEVNLPRLIANAISTII